MHDSLGSNLLKIYKNCHPGTKLNVLARFYTCPFFEVEKHVPTNGLILDYGCGHGIFSHILSSLSVERRVFGYDISSSKMNQAMKSSRNNLFPRFIEKSSDAESLIKRADCIVLLDVLYYYPTGEREEFLRWLYANIKPGCELVIKDINKSFSLKFLLLFLQEVIAVKLLRLTQGSALNFLSADNFLKLLRDAGFTARVCPLRGKRAYPHILFVAKKEPTTK